MLVLLSHFILFFITMCVFFVVLALVFFYLSRVLRKHFGKIDLDTDTTEKWTKAKKSAALYIHILLKVRCNNPRIAEGSAIAIYVNVLTPANTEHGVTEQ